jgi:hypothetical protein
LICKNCGGKMRIVSFITEPSVIRQILDHLRKRKTRDPPCPSNSCPSSLLIRAGGWTDTVRR